MTTAIAVRDGSNIERKYRGYSVQQWRKFFEYLREYGQPYVAAEAAGIHRAQMGAVLAAANAPDGSPISRLGVAVVQAQAEWVISVLRAMTSADGAKARSVTALQWLLQQHKRSDYRTDHPSGSMAATAVLAAFQQLAGGSDRSTAAVGPGGDFAAAVGVEGGGVTAAAAVRSRRSGALVDEE